MTTTISIAWGVIVVAVAITWALIVKGQSRQNAANYLIIHLLNKIISDTGELDALRCVNPTCKRRNTPDETTHKRLVDVGREAFMTIIKVEEDVEQANIEAAESAKEAPESLPEFDRERIRQGDKKRLHRKLDAELKGDNAPGCEGDDCRIVGKTFFGGDGDE